MSSPEWWEAHHQLAKLKPGTSWFGPIGHAIAQDIAKVSPPWPSHHTSRPTCLKSILKALASSEGAELSELRKGARGKLSAAAFDAFVSDLVNGRWLELGDDGEVAYGPRAILELADVLRGHGAEVPQMVNY